MKLIFRENCYFQFFIVAFDSLLQGEYFSKENKNHHFFFASEFWQDEIAKHAMINYGSRYAKLPLSKSTSLTFCIKGSFDKCLFEENFLKGNNQFWSFRCDLDVT